MTKNKEQLANARLIWWEKSVEWQFIALAVKDQPLALVAALDDKPEQALGDAIFGEGSKFALIEFKKDRNALSSERKKYADKDAKAEVIDAAYNVAMKALAQEPAAAAHVLIYGKLLPHLHDTLQSKPLELSHFLKLIAAPYWNRKASEDDVLDWCEKNGVASKDFDPYLAQLAAMRVSDSTGGGRSIVVAVSGSGRGTFILDVDQYNYLRATPAMVLKDGPTPEVAMSEEADPDIEIDAFEDRRKKIRPS